MIGITPKSFDYNKFVDFKQSEIHEFSIEDGRKYLVLWNEDGTVKVRRNAVNLTAMDKIGDFFKRGLSFKTTTSQLETRMNYFSTFHQLTNLKNKIRNCELDAECMRGLRSDLMVEAAGIILNPSNIAEVRESMEALNNKFVVFTTLSPKVKNMQLRFNRLILKVHCDEERINMIKAKRFETLNNMFAAIKTCIFNSTGFKDLDNEIKFGILWTEGMSNQIDKELAGESSSSDDVFDDGGFFVPEKVELEVEDEVDTKEDYNKRMDTSFVNNMKLIFKNSSIFK